MRNSFKILIAIAAIGSFAFISPKNNETRQINVVIDAGHGGKDFGSTYDGLTEKDIVNQITSKIKAQNDNANVVIHLTRSNDEMVPLADRAAFGNKIKADLVLSLHVNASENSETSGIEMYVAKENNAKSNELAAKLGRKLAKNHDFKVGKAQEANLMILKKSEAPAVVLELGYLTNDRDRKYLTNESQQNRIAATILEFINEI